MSLRYCAFIAATAFMLNVPVFAADPAQKLPADDNVQAQTQAKVRQPHATPHHGFRRHNKSAPATKQAQVRSNHDASRWSYANMTGW